MKNVISISALLVVAFTAVGCAGTGLMGASAPSAPRGSIVARGQATKAIVSGPTVIHAYTADVGGGLYTASAVTGSDADCAAASPGVATPGSGALRPEQRVVLNVASGQVACLATSGGRRFELLWHAHDTHNESVSSGHTVQVALAISHK